MARIPGETFTVWVISKDDDGVLTDITGGVTLSIYDPTKTLVASSAMTNPSTGTYRGDYTVPIDTELFGNWVAEAAGTSGAIYRKVNRQFEVGALS